MPLLIDLEAVPDECCDDALNEMAKAMSFGPVAHLWDPAPNPYARFAIEAVSSRLTDIIRAIETALRHFLSGRSTELRKATDEPWLRMDSARFEVVRSYLESKSPETMTLDDYRLLISWLLARYLPEDTILTEAEYIGVVAAFMGKVQASLEVDRRVTDPMIATIAALVPTDFAHVPPRVLTPTEIEIMTYTKAHAAEAIRGVAEYTRHRMARVILEHQQAGLLGQKEGTGGALQTRLFDEFSDTNRDMRRIAVTEVGEGINQGYVAAKATGQRVKRQEAYSGACSFCRSISGMVFEVVAADAPEKDGWRQIWPGKSNIGRSASPMRRVGSDLVARDSDELWWPASGLQHPNCRGSWVPVTNRPPEVSEPFFNWMQQTLDKAQAEHPV